jgi:hypothetical protein
MESHIASHTESDQGESDNDPNYTQLDISGLVSIASEVEDSPTCANSSVSHS